MRARALRGELLGCGDRICICELKCCNVLASSHVTTSLYTDSCCGPSAVVADGCRRPIWACLQPASAMQVAVVGGSLIGTAACHNAATCRQNPFWRSSGVMAQRGGTAPQAFAAHVQRPGCWLGKARWTDSMRCRCAELVGGGDWIESRAGARSIPGLSLWSAEELETRCTFAFWAGFEGASVKSVVGGRQDAECCKWNGEQTLLVDHLLGSMGHKCGKVICRALPCSFS